MAANLVKAYATCDDEGSSVAWLLEHAHNEYPGPTHMDICPRPERQRRVFIERLVPVAPETEHVDRVLDRIDGSQRPALVLGSLAARCLPRMDWNSLTLPMVTTAAGKGIVDEKGDWAGGVITGEVKPLSPETGILAHADLVIGVGLRNGEMVRAEPFTRPLVLVDVVVGQDSGFNADERLSGVDLSEVLPSLFQALREKRWGDDIVQLHRQDVWRAVTDGGWIPGQAFEVLDRYRCDNVTLVPDTGFFCTLAETVWRARTSQSFCGSSVGRFMGIAIPTAIGLALAEPERNIFCCFGDGGIAPYLGELTIAVEERLPIVFLFFTDGRYGSIASFAPEDPVLSRAYTFADPRWTDVAEAIGYHVARATNPERLNDCLDAWRREQGPLFVELPFESKGYAETAMILR
jgi:thiamine pyrophosphate-dependent acetolactate synthase large subunit-like protein